MILVRFDKNIWNIAYSSLFISQNFSSVISIDLEEVVNRERIVNVVSKCSFLYIYYPSKTLIRKVLGGKGY